MKSFLSFLGLQNNGAGAPYLAKREIVQVVREEIKIVPVNGLVP